MMKATTSQDRSSYVKPLQQAGMVSIMVTLVMMLVISLIVLGFAEVSRRNSREALDRQLSTQAFYAAETGINDVVSALKDPVTPLDPSAPGFNNNCSSVIGALGNKNNLGDGIAYTCVLINSKLKRITTPVSLGSTQVVPLTMSAASPLTFTWQPYDTSADVNDCSTTARAAFTPNGARWLCPYGVLEVNLYKDAGSADPATMAQSASTIYMVPHKGGGGSATVSFGAGKPLLFMAKCDSNSCTATVKGISQTNYSARLTSVYGDAGNVTITGGPGIVFTGAGVEIDSTGKSQDVLRRLQVRVDINAGSIVELPTNTLQSSGGICKNFTIQTAAPNDHAQPNFNAANALPTSGPLCDN